ncbi:Uncharacterized protein SCF082_LOCUS33661 [Durusdinium trenchii]|uniref:Uncharacterized protein n=1 Tax=Durusdinium trenchii TaxID=1381693 RepID=A0ABP0NU27_9DINO|eukprot:g6094.t1
MVILDGRCLCVQSCCCLNLRVPSLEKKQEKKTSPLPELTKAFSNWSLSSEATRIDHLSSRESSSTDSEHWASDFELTGWSLFRTRRFVAIPSALLEDEDVERKEDEQRQKLRRRSRHGAEPELRRAEPRNFELL